MSDPLNHRSPPGASPAALDPGAAVVPALAPAPRAHDPYAALRQPSFVLFALGGIIANIGSQMQSVAVGWEIYQRTGKAMDLGWVGLVQALPIMLLALPAGHLADRFDRRWIVVAAQAVVAACSLGLAALSHAHGSIALMYGCLFLAAMARAFHFPAGAAMLPQIVSREDFSNAVTWRSSGFQVAAVVGPALGGLLIAWRHSATAVYLVDASATLLFLAMAAVIRLGPQTRSTESASVRSLLAGLGFVWRSKVILAALTLDLFGVLLGGATALLPVYQKDILKVGPEALGWMRAAPAVGALVMALVMAHLPPLRRAGRALLWAVAGFGVATVVFGVSRALPLSLLMLAVTGALDNVSVVVRHTLVQTRTPDAMRGRVSAVNSVFISASNELGSFESGLVAGVFGSVVMGAVVSVVSGGVGTLLVVLATAAVWPEIRRLGPLVEAEEEKSAE